MRRQGREPDEAAVGKRDFGWSGYVTQPLDDAGRRCQRLIWEGVCDPISGAAQPDRVFGKCRGRRDDHRRTLAAGHEPRVGQHSLGVERDPHKAVGKASRSGRGQHRVARGHEQFGQFRGRGDVALQLNELEQFAAKGGNRRVFEGLGEQLADQLADPGPRDADGRGEGNLRGPRIGQWGVRHAAK